MKTRPNENDWRSEPWCLDAKAAYDRFYGATLDEAIAVISEDALNRQEDLMFMPAICFRYYLPAYFAYLQSDAARGDSDAASCLFGLIENRLQELSVDAGLSERTAKVIEHVGERQQWYDADESIYGSFKQAANRLLRKLSQQECRPGLP